MYVAKETFNSLKHGKIEKGQEAPFNEAWLKAGLIEEGKPATKKETKPEPKKQPRKRVKQCIKRL